MKPTVICLTPVKNEAWILDRFLKSASLWADYIIIADQMSTDGSREIAKRYSKVILIDNPSATFNEPERQKLLIDEARKIQGQRLLITLDADEILTPNVINSPEWQKILSSEPGTIFKFQMANLKPGFKKMWVTKFYPWGYMDDGAEHIGTKIHSARIPLPPQNKSISVNEIKVLHFQFTNWDRMQSKHRWYQCYEVINFPKKSPITIFRMYNHMYGIKAKDLLPLPKEWIEMYARLNIDITYSSPELKLWWDEQILHFLDQYGASFFKKINIWDIDWNEKSKLWQKENNKKYNDPRNTLDKLIFLWLKSTQKINKTLTIKLIDKLLKLIY